MRFVMMYRPDRKEDVPLDPEVMAALGQNCAELKKAGIVLWSEGLKPSASGARIRNSHGKIAVTDGPFTESKELIAGVNLIETQSKEEAIELARKFVTLAGEGEIEIRKVFEASDFFLESAPEEGPGR
jgi:hypothetical protein